MIWITTILGFIRKSANTTFELLKKFFKWDSEQGKWLSPLKTFIILGILIYLLYLHSCSQLNCPNVTEGTDTVTVTKIDTVWFEKPQTTIGKKPKKKSGGTAVTPNPTSPCDSLFQYTQEYEDSLIKGVLTADVKGEFIGSSFNYTPKFPKYITKTETITITNTIKEEILGPRPYGVILGGGLNVGHNASFGFTIDAGVQFKQGFDVIYRFDPLRLQHSVGLSHTFEFGNRNKKK